MSNINFKYPTSFKEILGSKVYEKVWKEADDVVESERNLGILYEDVPKDLENIPIQVMEIHIFPEQHKERIKAYLDGKPFNNSVEFIKNTKE